LKRVLAILVVSLLLFQISSKSLILFNFILNQKEIAATLCVKKEIPNNCCQGSCHLTKQLETQKENETPDTKVENTEEIIWGGRMFIIAAAVIPIKSLAQILFPDRDQKLSRGFILGLFRPPGEMVSS